MSKPTHNIVYVNGKTEEKEYTKNIGSAWLTDGGAIYLDFKIPLAIQPGDDNLKILPKKQNTENKK